jgi:DNA-nicking Smr family endonuclease
VKVRALHDLAALRDVLRQRAAQAAQASADEQAQAQGLEQQHTAFANAVGRVQTLPEHGRADLSPARPLPLARQRELDERAALREAMSDEVDVESLLLTDDGLSFRRPGLPGDVVTRLRRGQWSIQSQIDLHGLRRDEARERLSAFVRQALRNGLRCVRVVHGKGHGSPGGEPVLKAKVQRWLAQCAEVIAFAQATGPQGGAGALVVLLERRGATRRSRATPGAVLS